MINVLIRTDFPAQAVEALRQIPEIELVFDDYQALKQENPIVFPQTVEALITDHRTPYHSGWDKIFPGLKLVVSMGFPPRWERFEQISDSGVECRYTVDAGTISVAEMTVASMVCLGRRQAWLNENEDADPQSQELSGKSLGIVGFGRIGKLVARLAHAFGMTIFYHDPKGSDGGPSAKSMSLSGLLSSSDYIALNLPLTPLTKGMINHAAMESIRHGAFLIDMSQEGIVDTAAMIAALNTGKLAGVAADVYDRARQKELGLERFPHCIWLPQRSALTRETQARAGIEAVRIVKEYFNV